MEHLHHTEPKKLTRREREVLSCISDGLSTKEIAEKLSISEYTVQKHRQNMLEKTGAENSVKLAMSTGYSPVMRPEA